LIRPDTDGLLQAADILTTLDMIRAKARFAIDNGCVKPIVSYDMTLELRSARHPLLARALAREGKSVVPLDIKLDRKGYILVISGPNAGGKSVCLKTVGLLQYMFQCGFLVPLLENSQMPLFDSIFIDIGDEQSIENDLSTYSSHLRNMKTIMANATSRSLVLIDEFGSGTEPVMGGAIAEAVLEKLRERGTFGVVTTHYSNLKRYATDAKGIVNGAMTFDAANIAPLFGLDMGIPGSSFAIEIARKTGLPEEIIASASKLAGSEHIDMERQLREIARDRRYWEQKRDRIRITDRRVEQLENEYAGLLESIKEERKKILREAKQEAKRITEEANSRIENTIRTIKESQAEREKTRAVRKELDVFKADMTVPEEDTSDIDRQMERVVERQRRRAERTGRQAAKPAVTKKPGKPAPEQGSKVRIDSQSVIGIVQSVKGKKAVVAFGNILTTVETARLEVVPNSEYRDQQRSAAPVARVDVDIAKRKLNFRPNIDLRGLRASEALEQAEEFIDDAIMVGVNTATILHGKGTGALKEEIRRYLRTVDEIESATDEHADRGGAGITVVTFRS
jgi:DNA mismatch repair protein MutS2